ncbi:MAG: undecaprenyl-diphosphatase [Anaerolineaceae bacterium]|nr:undecaprenyl-diphosphatase [Anaerolineaceae bacterium]
MSEWIKVIILGIVEGITEFLPISSTGHLIVTAAVLDFQNSLGGTFEIFIQLGAVIAVLFYYSQDLLQQVREVPRNRNVQHFWLSIVVATIPAVILGLLLRQWIKAVLYSPTVVAISLIVGGIVFLLVERRPRQHVDVQGVKNISLRQALTIGLIQTIAFIPGVSRSGASIIGGMSTGLDRKTATEFSFYLAIPTLGGATILELLDVINSLSGTDLAQFILGAVISAVVAWLSIGFLLRYISSNTFKPFGYYRIAAGLIILVLVAGNIL